MVEFEFHIFKNFIRIQFFLNKIKLITKIKTALEIGLESLNF